MDSKKKYDLMVKLSDFYVKYVQKNLEGFDKARYISYTSKIIFYYLFLSILLFVGIGLIFGAHGLGEIPLLPIAFLFNSILVIGGVCFLRKLKKMDSENIIQVFKHNNGSTVIPTSADEEIKKHLMSKFLQIFGDFEWYKSYQRSSMRDLSFVKSLKILNNPISFIDDCIIGVYNGININIFDGNTSVLKADLIVLVLFLSVWLCCFSVLFLPLILLTIVIFVIKHITSKGFSGVIVEIDMNKNFEGHTFILEKNNIKDNLLIDSSVYEKVNIEDAEFMQDFCIYSQDQIEARYILTTAFIERLKNIKTVFKAKYIRAAFKDEKIIIMIQTGRDMFQMAGKSAITKETFVQLMDEIISVLDIVDILKLNEKLGL